MHRSVALVWIPVLVVLLACTVPVEAKQATPASGTPTTGGAVGVTAAVLGTAEPAAAAGQVLRLVRSTWAPGATVDAQTHPGTLISFVDSGAHGFTLLEGTARVTRAAVAGTPGPTEEVAVGAEVVLNPGDVLVIDQDAVHSHRNASDGETVLLEAQLYAVGEPAAHFSEATPAP
jgi:quercetin dioxygenase-like cupin family protein